MELGMYSLELERPTVERLFRAIHDYGFRNVQFDFQSVGEDEMPANIDSTLTASILQAARDNDVKIVSVNGTFNMIHPDPVERNEGICRFEMLASHMHELDCNLITLCTGSRNPNMWMWNDANLRQSSWDDLLVTMQCLLTIAEKYDVILGLEIEPNNCMNTVERCRQILDVFQSTRLKVIVDIANMFHKGEASVKNVRPVMRHAFDLLGKDVILAHGKDILAGDDIQYTYAGKGIVDFSYFRELLDEVDYTGCTPIHDLKHEEEFPICLDFINREMIC